MYDPEQDPLFRDFGSLPLDQTHRDGSLYWTRLHGKGFDGNHLGPVIGELTLNLSRVAAMYGRFLKARRLPTDSASEANMGRWLKAAGWQMVLHLADDLPVVLDVARCEEERAQRATRDTPPPLTVGDVKKHATSRDHTYSQLCTFGLLDLLEHQIAAVVPSAPKLKQAETDNLSVLSYLAVAVDTGDRAAIEAILKWLKGAAKVGMNELDWITILREFSVTRKELRPVLKALKGKRQDPLWRQQLADTPIGKRLAAHSLTETISTGAPPTPSNLAADLIGRERQISPANLLDKWNRDKRRVFEGLQIPD